MEWANIYKIFSIIFFFNRFFFSKAHKKYFLSPYILLRTRRLIKRIYAAVQLQKNKNNLKHKKKEERNKQTNGTQRRGCNKNVPRRLKCRTAQRVRVAFSSSGSKNQFEFIALRWKQQQQQSRRLYAPVISNALWLSNWNFTVCTVYIWRHTHTHTAARAARHTRGWEPRCFLNGDRRFFMVLRPHTVHTASVPGVQGGRGGGGWVVDGNSKIAGEFHNWEYTIYIVREAKREWERVNPMARDSLEIKNWGTRGMGVTKQKKKRLHNCETRITENFCLFPPSYTPPDATRKTAKLNSV